MKDGARYLKQKVTKYVPLTSGSNPHSYEATKAAAKKAQKKGSKGIRTHDLCDNSVMLYQLSYEASLEAGQERVQFIPNLLYEESEMCIWYRSCVHCRYRILLKVILPVMNQLKQLSGQKEFWGFNGIGTHDLCDTSAMLFHHSEYVLFIVTRLWTG